MKIESKTNYNFQNLPSKNPVFRNRFANQLPKKMSIDGKLDMVRLIEKFNPKNTIVGVLPPVLFYALPEVDREAKIKEIFDVFAQVANEIRNFKPTIDKPYEERRNYRTQDSVDKLKKVFVDLKIINEDSPFNLKFLGDGNYKKAYKIDGVVDPSTNEELCFKVFHVVDKTQEWHKYKTHGNYAEINTSIYWMKNFGFNTQRGKFYFGDVDNGYFLDKYIDEKVGRPKRYVDETIVGVKLTDEFAGDTGHNKLFGYSIDPGGPRVVNRVKNESATARRIYRIVKGTDPKYRQQEWYKILADKRHYDERQKQAGLAIAIKYLENRSKAIDMCLEFNNPFADIGLAYVLKYQRPHNAKRYFETLMKRNNKTTQIVLLNEIPLLARKKVKVDDLDVPKGEIDSNLLYDYYKLAQSLVLPEVEEHLASYIHLLPDDKIIPEAKKLIEKNDYEVNDRLLHKIKYVKDEEFSFGNKMEILNLLEKSDYFKDKESEEVQFLREKLKSVRVYVIRNQLED